MIRRQHYDRVVRGGRSSSGKRGRDRRVLSRRQFTLERLEERYLLSGTPLETFPVAVTSAIGASTTSVGHAKSVFAMESVLYNQK